MLFVLLHFYAFNSYLPAETATVELQTNVVFYFLFKIQFSVSDNTVISFHSKGRMGFSFLLYLCVKR